MENQDRIMGILSQVAMENGVSLETVIHEINKVIEEGIHSPDLLVRKKWERIPREGAVPTAVELVSYCVSMTSKYRIADCQ